MRYPCSYMIYSEAFDGMPDQAREAAYKRMWQTLLGEEKTHKYSKLSLADRQAIVEILRETKRVCRITSSQSRIDVFRRSQGSHFPVCSALPINMKRFTPVLGSRGWHNTFRVDV